MTSNIKNDLWWKYRKQRFLKITEDVKEMLWQAVTLLVAIALIAYMGAHFLLWITGYYNVSQAIIIH